MHIVMNIMNIKYYINLKQNPFFQLFMKIMLKDIVQYSKNHDDRYINYIQIKILFFRNNDSNYYFLYNDNKCKKSNYFKR